MAPVTTAPSSAQGSAPLLSLAGSAGMQPTAPLPSPTPSPGVGAASTGTATPSSLSRLTLGDKLLLAQAVHHVGSVPPDWARVSALVLNHPLIKTSARIETVSKAGFTLGRVFGSRECERAWIALMRMYGLVYQPGETQAQSQSQSMTQEDEEGNAVQTTPKNKESRAAAPKTDKTSQLQLAQLLYAERLLELRNQIKEKEDKFRELVQEVEAVKTGARDDALRAELALKEASEHDDGAISAAKESVVQADGDAEAVVASNEVKTSTTSTTAGPAPSKPAQISATEAEAHEAPERSTDSPEQTSEAPPEPSAPASTAMVDTAIPKSAAASPDEGAAAVVKPAETSIAGPQSKRPIPPPIKTSTSSAEQPGAIPAVVLTQDGPSTPKASPRQRTVTDGSSLASPAPSVSALRRRSGTLSGSRSASPAATDDRSQSASRQEEASGSKETRSESEATKHEERHESSPSRPTPQRAGSSVQKRKRAAEAVDIPATRDAEQSARKRTRASTNRPVETIAEDTVAEAEEPPTPTVGRPRRGGRTDSSSRDVEGDLEKIQSATSASTPAPPSTPGPSKQLRRSGRASLAGDESVPPTPVSAGPTRSTRSRKASPSETRETVTKVESEDEQQRASATRERSQSTIGLEEHKEKEDAATRASVSLSPVSSRRPSRGGGRGRASSVASRDSGRERSTGPSAKKDDKEKARRKKEKMLLMLLDEVSNHTHGNLFHNPIKEQDAPDYYQLVRHPLDLKTIRSKVKDGQIVNSAQLRRALNHMFANSLIYNRPGTEVHRMATEMRDAAEGMVDQFEQTQQMSRR
ncbi:hypothetical protein IE81DRAFT_324925 [Ceraceosorus guamensis]|uniref:Bromo domain-containing protein n=1 Tax=Ceraceosorus guamensis TaxID=1522189 RepID=A0A316VUI1_9BASI|nr:hypothetical protein IE81DRAFT_324925 [Ceraceosorus guamensis]PWN41100.1 hypothetical protein IE81DRAFT_324925 [Ceraceosorus guamensis]